MVINLPLHQEDRVHPNNAGMTEIALVVYQALTGRAYRP